jgi:hypothetical protein
MPMIGARFGSFQLGDIAYAIADAVFTVRDDDDMALALPGGGDRPAHGSGVGAASRSGGGS